MKLIALVHDDKAIARFLKHLPFDQRPEVDVGPWARAVQTREVDAGS